MVKKSQSLYQLMKNSSPNMRDEFLLCLERMMNLQKIFVEKELDIISIKNPVETDDYGPKSYMVQKTKYHRSHENA